MEFEAYDARDFQEPSEWQRIKRWLVGLLDTYTPCGVGLDEHDIKTLEEEERLQRSVLKYRLAAIGDKQDSLQSVYALNRQCMRPTETLHAERDTVLSVAPTLTSISFGTDEDLHQPIPPSTKAEPYVFGEVGETPAALPAGPELIDLDSILWVEKPKVVAPIIGSVLCVVDSKIGNSLEHTSSNRAIVEKVALQVMRTANMRASDISVHIAHVVECYFQSRENLSRAGHRRRRLPQWVLKSLGFKLSTVAKA